MITLHMLDGSTHKVAYNKARTIRNAWVLKEYDNNEQREFINNLAKIEYSPHEVYCLHRFEHAGSVSMIYGGRLYKIKCKQCDETRVTDVDLEG